MGIDTAAKKVQINKLVNSQVPSFVAEDNPLFVDFLKQYYVSEESKGKSIDLITNFNDYQKAETYSESYNLIGFTTCTSLVNSYDATINVSSTDGWPSDYGLLKIDDEIITYTGITSTSFTGCVRGFCGVDNLKSPTNPEALVFSTSNASKHENNSKVVNLSNLFLQEFWHKTKELFMPGFEDRNLHEKVDKANFLRQAKDFYASKGTDEAVKILFGVLFDSRAEVIKPIEYLFSPSDGDYVITNDLIVERISGNANNVVGQTLFQTDNAATSGSIFNVQYFPRDGRDYYIISLSKGSIVGTFEPTGSSSLINPVSIGTTVITVDSTLGFPESGELYVGAGLTVGIATYTSKTSTQFYGVSGISSSYTDTDFVRSSKTVFAYENGDASKPVFFRLTNVANNVDLSDVGYLNAGDIIVPRQIGKVSDATNYHLNSWIDNVKLKVDVARSPVNNESLIDDFTTTATVTTVAPHSLKDNDIIILRDVTNDDQQPDDVEGRVINAKNYRDNPNQFNISIDNVGVLDKTKHYVVERQLNYAKSFNNQLGVSNFTSDIQNTYITKNNQEIYVTSGSLPSYEIRANNRIRTFTDVNIGIAETANQITIPDHKFFNGELVKYSPLGISTLSANSVVGLDTGSIYAVLKIDNDTIKLSRSIPDAAAGKEVNITGVGTTGAFTFQLTPSELSNKNVTHQNFLRRFPVTPEPSEYDVTLQNEPVGMFLNGVEILSNQSGDSVHFGKIERIDVENGGQDYDVITPPNIAINDVVGVGIGTSTSAYAVVEGNFKSIDVLSGGYDLKTVPNVSITGGNGTGASAKARLRATRNSRTFDAKTHVNATADVITFLSDHLFFDGETVVYENNTSMEPVGGLVHNSVYFVDKVNDTQIKLTGSLEDAVAGTNPIDITGISTGSHKIISTTFRNVLDKIEIENAGSGYSNRKVIVNSNSYPSVTYFDRNSVRSGINTANNYIYFRSHGFKSGDLVEYKNDATFKYNASNNKIIEIDSAALPIAGLQTSQNYQIIVLDENKFRLCSAGIGTTTSSVNYFKGRYVDLQSNGSGNHTFKYPDISVSLQTTVGFGTTALAPVVRPRCLGTITDVFLTKDGGGYGSGNTLNAHLRPLVTISNGKSALVTVGVNTETGEITGAFVKIKGNEYASPPELIVEGEGKYAKLLSNVNSDGSLADINIIDSGKSYTQQPNTTVRVKPQGSGAVFRADLTEWKLTSLKKYEQYITDEDDGIIVPSQNPEYGSKFTSVYLPRKLRIELDDNIDKDDLSEQPGGNFGAFRHSPIVGWAYDGAPIYGPYGHDTPTGGVIRRLKSSYTLNLKTDRSLISDFALGSFVEDYDYTADGDLDMYNGRFCKTPEYPNGVYAYFCTIGDQDGGTSPFRTSKPPQFPYSLNGYKFKKVEMNGQPLSLQNMSVLNSGELLRNTLPYKLGFVGANYDYLVSDNIDDTELLIKTISTSGIGSVNVLTPGVEYKVKDRISFNNSESGGRGASAKVRTLVGKGINQITYNKTTVDNIAFDYGNGLGFGIADAPHGLQNNDLVNISGIGTGEMRFLEGPRTIGVSSITSTIGVAMTVRTAGTYNAGTPQERTFPVGTGPTAFLDLTDVVGGRSKDDDIAVGDIIVVGNNEERLKVLEIDTTLNRYKVLRQTGIGQTFHHAGKRISIDQKRFTFSIGINSNLNIARNELLIFDPQSSIGIGTTTQVVSIEAGIGTFVATDGSGTVLSKSGIGTHNIVRIKTNDGTLMPEVEQQLYPPHEGQPGSNGTNLISIPNHGFATGQRLKYNSGTGTPLQVSTLHTLPTTTGFGKTFSLEDDQFVFVVKISDNLLGLSTTRTGIGSTSTSLYFANIVANNLTDHSLKTTNEEHIGSLDRYDVVVNTSEAHELKTKDQITVDVAPNTLVNKSIEYDTLARKTIVDPKYVNSSAISITDSAITITDHGFNDGDKVLYAGLSGINGLVLTGSGSGYKINGTGDGTLTATATSSNGSGTGLTLTLTVSSGTFSSVTIVAKGQNYKVGDTITIPALSVPDNNGNVGSGITITVSAIEPFVTPLKDRGEYYTKRLTKDKFRLFDNRKDSISIPNAFVNITNVGQGFHRFARINPPIKALRGETVGFAVSDTSLTDFKLEFYKDENFTNKFDGVGISTEIVRTGVSGVSASTVKVKLTDNIELPLWYKLVPVNLDTIDVTKRDSEPDKQVINGSKITIDPSVYAGNFGIKTTGTTSFTYQVPYKPEVTSYATTGITTFRYLTKSLNATGGINEVSIDFGGVDYIKNPGINTIRTVSGRDADVRMFDDYIGRAGYKEVIKMGYDYPTDKSLSPRADTPVTVTVKNNFAIGSIGVVTSGRNYSTAPDLFFIDRPNADTEVSLEGTGIGSIRILRDSLTGFDLVPNPPRIYAVNNSNGVGVVTATSNGVTQFITIKQPIGGWRPADHVRGTNFPFEVGDEIFVENINIKGEPELDAQGIEQGYPEPVPSTDSRNYEQGEVAGYNSRMYDYRYFTITNRNITDSRIQYTLTGIGSTGGKFDPDNSAGRVIKKQDLPTFSVTFENRDFINGEPVTFGNGEAKANIVKNEGWDPNTNSFRLEKLTRTPYVGDVVVGKISRAQGRVVQSKFYEKYFSLGFNAEREKGWQKNTGKLSNNLQRIQDSDYYQNFSYSIQSEVQEKDFADVVDSNIHPSGYKNFSDLIIKTLPTVGLGRTNSNNQQVLAPRVADNATGIKVDIDNVASFLVTNDYDFATEETISTGLSKFISFQNRKIKNLLSIKSARVELIDDISGQFTGFSTVTGGQIVGLSSFRLTSQTGAVPLFSKRFNPGDPLSRNITVGSDVITINNHGFQVGEEIKYDSNNNTAVGINPSGNMPSSVFVHTKLDNNRFKLSTTRGGSAFTIRTLGSGTEHFFNTINPENKTLIQVDGMIQTPLHNRSVNLNLLNQVGINSTSLKLEGEAHGNPVGLTTVKLNDIIQIGDELMRVKTVGVGSTNAVSVERGFLGTTKAAHAVNATPQMKGGNFRIEKDVVFFATPPYGLTGGVTGVGTQSTFAGRVFSRRDITKNFVFDDISHQFTGETGVGRTFTLLQNEQSVSGIITAVTSGSRVINYGVVLINGIFQRPTVDYDLVLENEENNGAIAIGASISFRGQTKLTIPKGGKVDEVDPVNLGANLQPRIPAGASAVVNGSGVITGVNMLANGSGYFSGSVNVEVLNPLGTGTPAVLAATVGTGNSAGMITGINVTSGGSGYNAQFPPVIKVGIATGYTNLSVTGSVIGTGLKIDAQVGAGGSIIDFNIKEKGFGYKNGEILSVQGIPFRKGVGITTSPFTLTVKSTIDDKFAGFSFGQLVPLDDFSAEFDGLKRSFVLTKTNITKEVVTILSLDTSIDATNNLLIFINDVLQKPRENYTLEGGTTVIFNESPVQGSKLQILFFRGGNDDIEALNPIQTVKVGDKLQLLKDLQVPNQSDRVISDLTDVSRVETPSYGGGGISTNPSLLRVVSWKKQDRDLIVDGVTVGKDRALQAANFFPNARLIRNVGVTSGTTYVDNAFPLFSAYDNRTSTDTIPGLIEFVNTQDISVGRATANVSTGGKVTSITVTEGGTGHQTVPTVSIANFNRLPSGINTTSFETIPLIEEVGRTWNKITAPLDISYNAIDYVPEGVFVAVGSTSGIHTSTDGNNWTVATTGNFGTFKGVVGLSSEVVAVGGGGTIARSTNAASSFTSTNIYQRKQVGFIPSYTPRNIPQSLNAVAVGSYIFPNAITGVSTTTPHERVVVVGAAGTILYTEPGLTGLTTSFVISNKFASQDFHDVAYHDGTFIAVGNQGSIYRSIDGETWSGVTTTSITKNLKGISYGKDKWIGVGQDTIIISSVDDGNNWSTVSVGGSFQLNSVHYENDVWLAVGGAGMAMNSIDGTTWFKKHVVAGGTPLGKQLNGVIYGDNKMVAVGIQSSLVWSGYEKVGATATATIGAGGTISAITVTDGGFGYTANTNPTVLLSQETITREQCNTVNISGDYGVITTAEYKASGPNSLPAIELTLDSDEFLEQTAFGNIARSTIAVGDYFVVYNSRVGTAGTGPTSIDKDSNIVGQGTTMIDNIYKVETVTNVNSATVKVACNVKSYASGIVTTASGTNLGYYSFGKLTNITRSSSPKSFSSNNLNGYVGVTTSSLVRRINPLSVTYSNFDQSS